MKKISNNDLNELIDLFARIQGEIHTYSHVEPLIPNKLMLAINDYQDKLLAELDKRQED